jgi:hypothetical protein
MNRGIQYFSKEYLKRCAGVSADQILEFLENYRMLFSSIREHEQKIGLTNADQEFRADFKDVSSNQ